MCTCECVWDVHSIWFLIFRLLCVLWIFIKVSKIFMEKYVDISSQLHTAHYVLYVPYSAHVFPTNFFSNCTVWIISITNLTNIKSLLTKVNMYAYRKRILSENFTSNKYIKNNKSPVHYVFTTNNQLHIVYLNSWKYDNQIDVFINF